MIDVEPLIKRDLAQLLPLPPNVQPDWADVQRRVRCPTRTTRGPLLRRCLDASGGILTSARRRPLLALLLVALAAAVPLSALAVEKSDPWWFLRFPGMVGEGPAKGTEVVLIKEGSWNGQRWALTAYQSVSGHLCYDMTLESAAGSPTAQGAGGCSATIGSIVPIPGGGHRRLTVSFEGGTLSSTETRNALIHYVTGPVIATASNVRITLATGAVITTPAFAVPSALGMPIRFYLARLPLPDKRASTCEQRANAFAQTRPVSLVGLAADGKVVASFGIPAPHSLHLCEPHRNHFVPVPELAGKPFTKVGRVHGPYGATATISVSPVIGMHLARRLPNGTFKRFVQSSRCWKVTFSNGQSQGTCVPLAKQYEPELGPWLQHAGRDTFVFVSVPPRIGAAIARVDLQLANGQTLTKKPLHGVVVFAVPKNALSTKKSQRGWLIAYDKAGHVLIQDNSFGHVRFARQAVYYRSCPPGTSCYG